MFKFNYVMIIQKQKKKEQTEMIKQQTVGAVYIYIYISNFIEKIEGNKAFICSEKGRLFKNKNSLSFCCF